jgi:hypothetical protein
MSKECKCKLCAETVVVKPFDDEPVAFTCGPYNDEDITFDDPDAPTGAIVAYLVVAFAAFAFGVGLGAWIW